MPFYWSLHHQWRQLLYVCTPIFVHVVWCQAVNILMVGWLTLVYLYPWEEDTTCIWMIAWNCPRWILFWCVIELNPSLLHTSDFVGRDWMEDRDRREKRDNQESSEICLAGWRKESREILDEQVLRVGISYSRRERGRPNILRHGLFAR